MEIWRIVFYNARTCGQRQRNAIIKFAAKQRQICSDIHLYNLNSFI